MSWLFASGAKVLELQLQYQSFQWIGLISFTMDWLDLLAVLETLKSLLQHHSSKASILWHSAFIIVQLSHPYMTTGKTIALTRWTFVGKVMSLLFNMLSRLLIAFLPKSKCLLISWLQSPSAVTLESRKIKSVIVSTVSPSICHEVMGLDAMILVFWMLSFKPTFPLSSFTFIKRYVVTIKTDLRPVATVMRAVSVQLSRTRCHFVLTDSPALVLRCSRVEWLEMDLVWSYIQAPHVQPLWVFILKHQLQRAVPQAASRRAPAPEQQEAEESWLPPVPLAHSGHSQWPYPQVPWGLGEYLQGLL